VVEDTPYCLRQICSPKTTFRQGIINGDILRDDWKDALKSYTAKMVKLALRNIMRPFQQQPISSIVSLQRVRIARNADAL